MNFLRLKGWFSGRYDFRELARLAKEKTRTLRRFDFGAVTRFLIALQFVTGMTLAFYYVPHPDFAHKSIIDIVTKLNMGWFFRSFHHWGAQLALLFLFIHLFGTLLTKSYRNHREFVWFTGFILLGISIFFGLSGYLLLWDDRALAGVKVATGGVKALPVIGGFLMAFLRGGIDVTGETLTRFYAFHVSLLPLATLFLVSLHVNIRKKEKSRTGFFLFGQGNAHAPILNQKLYHDLIVWLLVLGAVATLAVFLPPEIGIKADLLAPTPENIKPEWYFLFVFQTLKLFPGQIFGLNGEVIAILLIATAMAILFLLPLIDKKSSRGEPSPLFTWVGIAYIAYIMIMTIVGYLS